MKLMKIGTAIALVLISYLAKAWDEPIDADTWSNLKNQAETARDNLAVKINQSAELGINTEYAKVSLTVIDTFLVYAQFDRDNSDVIQAKVDAQWWKSVVPNNYAIELPFEQLEDAIEVAESAIAQLTMQETNSITLKNSPNLTSAPVLQDNGVFKVNNDIVFPSTFNWMPKNDELIEAFGRIGGIYYPMSVVNQDGGVSNWAIDANIAELNTQNQKNISPKVFFLGYNAAQWQKDAAPEAFETGRLFVNFDIDNPSIRQWYGELFEHHIPAMLPHTGDDARMHLIANEPHFATREGGWLAENGVSSYTKTKYQNWLQEKYGNISALNQAYGTNYNNFTQARDGMTVPVPINLQGGAIWYDWCRFNMDRVTNWFTFLKEGIQQQDPNVPVTIKLLGWIMGSEWRDHGIDIESLAQVQDVLGSDLNVTPFDAVDSRQRNEDWPNHYSIDWVEQSMTLDFYKSIAPGKPFYDSEWHGLANDYHHINMEPEYIRAAMWLAFTHGVNMLETWVWGREEDGDASTVNSVFYAEATTQPWVLDSYGRTIKELNAHSETVNNLADRTRKFRLFYSEDSAIQDRSYIQELKLVYEALKLANFDVGFTTPNDLENLNSNHVLIVPPTPYQDDIGYQDIKNFSGTKVLVNPSESFLKNELGVTRQNSNVNFNHSVVLGTPESMASNLLTAIGNLQENTVSYTIKDTNGNAAYGLMVHQWHDNQSGETITSVINIDREPRVFSLNVSGNVENILTGQTVSKTQTLNHYDLLILKSSNTNDTSLPTGWLNLKIAHSNMCVDIENASANNGNNIRQSTCNNVDESQAYKLVEKSTGGYEIRTAHDKCLGVSAGSTENAANLIQWQCNGSADQEFVFEAEPSSQYRIRATHSNKCIEVEAFSTLDGANISQYTCHGGNNQLFELQEIAIDIPSDATSLIAQHSNMCIDLAFGSADDGTNIQQWNCNSGNTNQLFQLVDSGNGYYQVQTKHNKCLGVNGGLTNDGSNVIQWQCNGSDDQLYAIQAVNDGWFELRPKHSNKCLEVVNSSTDNGATIQQWQCNANANQLFKFD